MAHTLLGAWRAQPIGSLSGGHIFGDLAGVSYRAPLRAHIFGDLAGANYRVPLGGHLFEGLAGATHRVATYTSYGSNA